jgi:hypothetical protein
MGWCPKCRAEYRPEIAVCPDCQVPLVDELPPLFPGERPVTLGSTALRALSFTRQVFIPPLRLALEAFQLLRKNKKLLAVVALLSTASFASAFGASCAVLARLRISDRALPSRRQQALSEHRQLTPAGRWLANASLTPSYVLADVEGPLGRVTALAIPWSGLLFFEGAWNREGTGGENLALAAFASEVAIGMGLAVDTVFLVAVLLCLLRAAEGKGDGYWGLLKARYLPIAVINIIPLLIVESLFLAPPFFARIDHTGWILARWATVPMQYSWLVFLLLTLAPFAIVSRGLGAWGGVKAGVWLLWRNKLTLLLLFLLYRVPLEAVNFLQAAVPSRRYFVLGFDEPGLLLVQWALWLARAALGLWLAMAFFLVIREETPSPLLRQGVMVRLCSPQVNDAPTGGLVSAPPAES